MTTQTDIETAQIKLWLNGTLESDVVQSNLLDAMVEQDLFLPDALTLRFVDMTDQPGLSAQGYYQLLDADKFALGSAIKVALGQVTPEDLFDGEVTSVELEVGIEGFPTLTVRGFDKSHRLRRERKTRAFVNSTDTDIARTIASGQGLNLVSDATSEVFPHVFQDNLTDWEFLRARAMRIGYDVYVRGSDLYFKQTGSNTTVVSLKQGQDLLRVRVRLSAPSQVSQVTVRGWDPKNKVPLVGTASSASHAVQNGEARTGAALSNGFGSGKFVLADRVVDSDSVATSHAQAVYDAIDSDLYQVDGACLGMATLRPGCTIDLGSIGQRFSGKYSVSAVTHRRRRGEAYVSSFVVNGRRAATLTGTLAPAVGGRALDTPMSHPSVVVGLVTDSKDTDTLGRVKVKFPWLDGGQATSTDGVATNWARVASPMAGNDRGLVWLPEVNDEVLVAFEHGDINRPFIIGGLWNGVDAPPAPTGDSGPLSLVGETGKVERRFIKTRLGHSVLLDDSDTSPAVIVKSKAGHSITLDDATATQGVVVKSNSGHTLKLDDTAAGSSVTVVDRSNNSIKIDSNTNSITIKCTGNLNIEATGAVSVKGLTVTIEATTGFTLKGNGPGTVESVAPLTVKGNPVLIN